MAGAHLLADCIAAVDAMGTARPGTALKDHRSWSVHDVVVVLCENAVTLVITLVRRPCDDRRSQDIAALMRQRHSPSP